MRVPPVPTGIILVCALVGTPAFAGVGAQASGSAQLSDQTIESHVEAVLK